MQDFMFAAQASLSGRISSPKNDAPVHSVECQRAVERFCAPMTRARHVGTPEQIGASPRDLGPAEVLALQRFASQH